MSKNEPILSRKVIVGTISLLAMVTLVVGGFAAVTNSHAARARYTESITKERLTPPHARISSSTLTETVNSVEPDYNSPGTYLYTVPPGVSQVRFDVYGAQGGGGGGSANSGGGLGGEARATLAVSAGETFQITVGTVGSAPAYHGGGGGGASDVRSGSCAPGLNCGLAERIVVAGGGGGGGGWGYYDQAHVSNGGAAVMVRVAATQT